MKEECFKTALTADHQPLRPTSVEHIDPHPGLTDIVSTISLLDCHQSHSVVRHLCKVGEISLTRSYQLGILKEDNFWSWETKSNTLDVH